MKFQRGLCSISEECAINGAEVYSIIHSDSTLAFRNDAEKSNLVRAERVHATESLHQHPEVQEYDLTIEHSYRAGWFYFAVENAENGVKYQFNVVNLCEKYERYCHGDKPLVCFEVSDRSLKS